MSDKCISVPIEFLEKVEEALRSSLNGFNDFSSKDEKLKDKYNRINNVSKLLSILINELR